MVSGYLKLKRGNPQWKGKLALRFKQREERERERYFEKGEKMIFT